MIEICYCIDKNTEICGFVSLHSLLTHASEKVSVMICYDREEKLPGADWGKQLASFGFDFDIRHQAVDNSVFRKCRSCFGSYAPYLLLSAPQYANSEKLLCLDADTIITKDIKELYCSELKNQEIGIGSGGLCQEANAIEKKLLLAYGKKNEDIYYGSTIVLFNAQKYKTSERLKLFKKIAEKDPHLMMLWDQTIINCAYKNGEIKNNSDLFGYWNQQAPRYGEKPEFHEGIIHYAGTPKPWDIFGEIFHPCYKEWNQAAKNSGIKNNWIKNYFSIQSIKRANCAKKQYSAWIKILK